MTVPSPSGRYVIVIEESKETNSQNENTVNFHFGVVIIF